MCYLCASKLAVSILNNYVSKKGRIEVRNTVEAKTAKNVAVGLDGALQ